MLLWYAACLEFTPAELKEIAKRVIDLERIINMREGITKADDTLPKRYFDDGMPAGMETVQKKLLHNIQGEGQGSFNSHALANVNSINVGNKVLILCVTIVSLILETVVC